MNINNLASRNNMNNVYISNEIWIVIYKVSEPIHGPISVIIELDITLLQLTIIISFKLRNN